MFNSPWMTRMGVTPAKLALVVVLAVVLVGVVVVQWPSNASAPATVSPPPSSPIALVAEPRTPTLSTAIPSVAAKAPWPELTLEEATRHNPFLLPAEMRRKPANSAANLTNPHSRQLPQELSQTQSGIVLMVEGEHVARIGAVRIRAGDKFGAYRVSKIDATGIWLVDERDTPE